MILLSLGSFLFARQAKYMYHKQNLENKDLASGALKFMIGVVYPLSMIRMMRNNKSLLLKELRLMKTDEVFMDPLKNKKSVNLSSTSQLAIGQYNVS